ncbi:myoneurin isoform X1 [Pseudochaenichthys georgianus]|uniref:myoneurin isoform X1 n=1 Tax=Pseudochaenichthys georgianus TaxID=52239 RepID=UPI00146D6218|nr:myoneurin isoform X1 [Pseudochaenichthys georgianus]
MVSHCVCAGCSNSSLSGYRVHNFPNRKRTAASFRSWVRFVQAKRRDFTTASATKNAVVCGAHFRQEDYDAGDLMQFRMGYRSQDRVRLITSAVPSIHPASLSAPVAAAAAAAGGGSVGQGSVRTSELSSEHPAVAGGLAGKSTSSSGVKGNINWDCDSSLDQITVVRIDDTHIAEDKDSVACYDVEYSIPTEEEANDEDDGVYVIEYSNPEEEGESYQFTMSVDQPLPTKKQIVTHAAARESVMSKPSRPQRLRRKRDLEEEVVSNKCLLELGEDYRDIMRMNSDKEQLVCKLCPPPGRFFKKAAGLTVHLRHTHQFGGRTFFCTTCQRSVRTQSDLDSHTKRHANQEAVFTCLLCKAQEGKAGYTGAKFGLKRHLEQEHPGVVPRCDICNKGFLSLTSYLADQFRHVGVSPYYCARCQIYEMTERGLSVHIRNDNMREKKLQESQNNLLEPESNLRELGVSVSDDNSATDDSDF